MCILHSSIASLLSCSPSIHPACIHALCSISIISLQTCGQPAGPTAYLHYLRCHIVYPSFIYCITAKLQPIQLLCQMYTLCSISTISLQTCGPPAGPRAYTHYVRTQEVHPVMTSFTSANCGSSSHSANILYIHYEAHPLYLFKAVACRLLRQHTHTMQDVIKCILY